MRISVKSLFFMLTWWAWLLGALLSGNRWLIESFTIGQYVSLAVAVSVAMLSKSDARRFAACFAAGFLSWYAYLTIESLCATMSFQSTAPGALIAALTDYVCNNDSLVSAQAKVEHYNRVLACVRVLPGSLLGIVTYVIVWFISRPTMQCEHK